MVLRNDQANIFIVGAGLSGNFAAIWSRENNPEAKIQLVEREQNVVPELDRWRGKYWILGNRLTDSSAVEGEFIRGADGIRYSIATWSGENLYAWLKEWGIPGIEAWEGGEIALKSEAYHEFQNRILEILHELEVEVHMGVTLTDFRPQPSGGYRCWFNEIDPVAAERIILASGGARSHVHKLLREHGVQVRDPLAGYIRLKPASRKWAGTGGVIRREVMVKDRRSGRTQTGEIVLGPRGFEGSALSALATHEAEAWRERRFRVTLEFDWVPEWSGGQLKRRMEELTQNADRRGVGEYCPLEVPSRLWHLWLKECRIPSDLPWSRLKQRQVQTLITAAKQGSVAFEGMGLPSEERAWAGGVELSEWNWESGELHGLPGVYVAGEILDVLGRPGGFQAQMAWASAYVAGASGGSGK